MLSLGVSLEWNAYTERKPLECEHYVGRNSKGAHTRTDLLSQADDRNFYDATVIGSGAARAYFVDWNFFAILVASLEGGSWLRYGACRSCTAWLYSPTRNNKNVLAAYYGHNKTTPLELLPKTGHSLTKILLLQRGIII